MPQAGQTRKRKAVKYEEDGGASAALSEEAAEIKSLRKREKKKAASATTAAAASAAATPAEAVEPSAKDVRKAKAKAAKDAKLAAEVEEEKPGKPAKAAKKGGGKKGKDFIKVGEDDDDLGAAEGLASFTPKDLAAPGPKVKASVSRAAKLANAKYEKTTGVVYLGHIPHGFYEKEMKGFFGQFGDITRLRLARNKKSGASRGFAFIEFEDNEVALIVAETMHNYLLCNHLLDCKVVDPEKLHPQTFVGANRKFRQVPWRSIERDRHNMDRTTDQQDKRLHRLVKREKKKRKQLEALGVEYEFPGYSEKVLQKPTKTTFA